MWGLSIDSAKQLVISFEPGQSQEKSCCPWLIVIKIIAVICIRIQGMIMSAVCCACCQAPQK